MQFILPNVTDCQLKAAGSVTFDILILELKVPIFQEHSKKAKIQV